MFQKIKSEVQIFITLVFAAAVLIFLSMSVQVSNDPAPAAGPTVEATVIKADSESSFREKIIAEYGLTEDEVTIAAANLSVSVNPSSVNRNPNSSLSIKVTITNNGPSPVNYIFFQSDFPKEYVFNNFNSFVGTGSPVVTNGQNILFLPGPLAANGGQASITVNGIIAANSCNGAAFYTATVYPLFETTNIKQSSTTINIVNSQTCGDMYFPQLSKFPTPTPQPLVYEATFDDDDGWPTGEFDIDDDDEDDCAADIDGGKYKATAYKDETCFFPAPKAAERTIGAFEVEFKRDGDSDSDKFDAGIYIDGEGGDEYYLFRIEYDNNNCDYRLYRHDSSKASGDCDDESNGYKNTNKLRITRNSSGAISIYLNGQFLRSYTDGSPYGGKGTGVYLRERTNDGKIVVDFDNFKVFTN